MSQQFGFRAADLAMPIVLIGILALMLLPLPSFIIDLLLALNVTLSLVILLTSIHVRRPLDFSVFPSLLLVATLFRLGLNVSTTRLILLHGSEGPGAAGHIVETFGSFVVGGNYVVGIVVFLILTLINFIVITKGSGRIAEVSARFTLDALPGKQMSIDSDLASGLVTQEQARTKRDDLSRETDFYGAMDGSSKFVRGDAIAGLIITAINILGGLIVGVSQAGMEFSDAAALYTVLTIGDGLVSQIPTLLISTSSGIVITRAAEEADLGGQVQRQLLTNPKVLVASAGILFALLFVPGMPIMPFLILISGLLWLARRQTQITEGAAPATRKKTRKGTTPPRPAKSEEEELVEVLTVHPVELAVGYGLVSMVNKGGDGNLVQRVSAIRKNIARDLGIVLPAVHIQDDLTLEPNAYMLSLHGVEVASGSIMVDRLLAMDPGDILTPIRGVETVEPAFGLPALWIRRSQRTEAEIAGYTVVEPATVLITHLSEALRTRADELLGREELSHLLELVAKRSPKLVDELVPGVLANAELLAVLRGLLREQVSIRDLTRILEALSQATRFGKTTAYLVDQVRLKLGASIIQDLLSAEGKLHAALFDATSEETLRQCVLRNESDIALAPDLPTAQSLLAELQRAQIHMNNLGLSSVVIAPADLRYPLWR
ncbi:MAG: flagellar biosynthesis protein FlhA, partial [Myxococcota bacterium]